jgi:hypothetical protein
MYTESSKKVRKNDQYDEELMRVIALMNMHI